MTAPDRIWCHPTERQPVPAKDRKQAKWVRGNWKDHDSNAHGDVEYVRLDLAVLAALPEVRALIDAERERMQTAVEAAGKLGGIIGFLGDDEARIEAFREACGPNLIERFHAAIRKGDANE